MAKLNGGQVLVGVLRGITIADRGYVIETGRVTLSGEGRALLADPAVHAAYLGM